MATSPQPKTGLPRVTAEFQERLIQEISIRSPLWDPTDAAYQNGAAIETLWYEVAEAMGVPVHVVRSKWKNLRDTYRREKKKLFGKKQCRKKKKPWTYTAHMSFIDPFVDVGRTYSEGESESDTNNNSKTMDDNMIGEMSQHDEDLAAATTTTSVEHDFMFSSTPIIGRTIKVEPVDEDIQAATQQVTKFGCLKRRRRMVGKVVGLQSAPLIKKLKPSPKTDRRGFEMEDEEGDEDNITCFSKHIASELRLIKDPNLLAVAKYKISQALFEAQLGLLAVSTGASSQDQTSPQGPSNIVFPNIANAMAFPTPTESYDSASTCNGSEVIIMPST